MRYLIWQASLFAIRNMQGYLLRALDGESLMSLPGFGKLVKQKVTTAGSPQLADHDSSYTKDNFEFRRVVSFQRSPYKR